MDVVELAPGGTIELYNANGNVDVIVDVIADVLGYFTTATMTWTDAVPSNPSAPPPAGLNQGPIGMVYDPATNQVLRISAGSDRGEQRPVGLAGVEQ